MTQISSDDYPASALRNEERGRVTSRALFGPDGELVMIEITSPPSRFDQVVRRSRRLEGRMVPTPGRYVWVDLKAINFTI